MSVDTQPIAWSWLKSVSRDLYKLDDTPLLGVAPQFNWERLAQEFQKTFALESVKITPKELVWKEKDAILAGVAGPYMATEIAATGIDGTVSFWMGREDVDHIMAKALQISEVVSELQTDEVVANFHRFLGIETICLVNAMGYDPRLSFKITAHTAELKEAALCQYISIEIGKEKMQAVLVIPNTFLTSWRTFFLMAQGTPANKSLDEVETIVHIEAARTTLPFADLLKIRPGDFVLLDEIFYEKDKENSFVFLTFNGKILFRARLQNGGLEILEIPLQNEVNTPMVEQVNTPEPPTNQAPPPEDENPFAEVPEDEDEGLELVAAAANTTIEELARPPEAPKPKKAAATIQASTPKSDKLTAADIPTQLIIEVASVNISVQKLLELAPGNMLDLGITPEAGVNLVVNGRIVGKGELLKIGETIGVRILQIGV
ncbi:MAG: type III secretion system cytoplasmic ring protein SctQ [Verrucomicrobia bacterium]|nr:type III secretion system cytoplasmic ring protein SctQ [Verrucomicrobiota bacterium]MBS0635879.1 type III secretion system cytoplasmic ring protein SctQ [Verrucomicrobiota bacterium]